MAVAVAAVAIGLASPENAAAAKVRIITPKEDAHIRKPVVRVKVRARGRRFHASLDGRKVTRSFRRRGRGLRTALLTFGRHFGAGDHVLTVRAGKRFRSRADSVRFIAMRRDDGTMAVTYRTDPRRRGSGLLDVRTRTRLWNTDRMPRVILNGRRVEDRLVLDRDDRGIEGGLGAEAGLRFGPNRLVVEMLQRNGRFARDVTTIHVPRDRPLAGAEPNATVGVRETVVLDASATRLPPALKGQDVDYRWSLVSAPRRSDGALRDADGVRGRLRPDALGTYVVRVKATPAGGGPSGVDEVVITGTQEDDPMGIPIQTIAEDGKIVVGGKSYGEGKEGVLMLTLSATGLTPVSGEWGDAVQTFTRTSGGHWVNGKKSGCRDLVTCVHDVNHHDLVILSGQGSPIAGSPLSGKQADDLAGAIKEIGGTLSRSGQTPNGAADLRMGNWSVIGNRVLAVGAADQNFFLKRGPVDRATIPGFPDFPSGSGHAGSLNGYMQNINEVAYQYLGLEYMPIDTKWTPSPTDTPSATQNTIKIGDTEYKSDGIRAGAIAFQVLVLDESGPMRLRDRGTFVVKDRNCRTNQAGVQALAQKLSRWVDGRPEPGDAGTKLVIVQDFGRQAGPCAFPGPQSPAWINDGLPSGVCGDSCPPEKYPFGWQGQDYPNDTSELFRSWNHSGATVAGTLGKLAGIPVHDVVANYRRRYYDDATERIVPRNFGGLTVIASTNLFQWGSAFHQGQGDDATLSGGGSHPELANGRVTGLLRRNEQSQWELRASASGAGWKKVGDRGGAIEQKAFFDLIFQDPKPWPCTVQNPAPCPNLPSEIRAAHLWFVSRVSPKSGATTVRDLYADGYLATFPVSKILVPYPGPKRGPGYFSPQVFQAMKHGGSGWDGIQGELGDVNQVAAGIQSWQNFFIEVAKANALVDIATVGQTVIHNIKAAYEKVEQETAAADAGGILGKLMLFASSVVEVAIVVSNPEAAPVLAPAMGAMGSALDLGDETLNALTRDGPSSGQGNVPNAPDAIEDKVSQLSADINKRYGAIADGLEHFGSIFVDDLGKLEEAAANFDPGAPWALTAGTENTLGQSIAAQAETAMYETALPIAFTQWMISPRRTNRNPAGPGELPAAKDYSCEVPGYLSEDGKVHPWYETSTWTLGSTVWTGGGPGSGDMSIRNSAPVTVRGLKSVVDQPRPVAYQYHDQTYFGDVTEGSLDKSGTSAKHALLRPLLDSPTPFGKPSDPGPLGASKEEVFGLPNWRIKLLQCGSPPLNTPNGVVDK